MEKTTSTTTTTTDEGGRKLMKEEDHTDGGGSVGVGVGVDDVDVDVDVDVDRSAPSDLCCCSNSNDDDDDDGGGGEEHCCRCRCETTMTATCENNNIISNRLDDINTNNNNSRLDNINNKSLDNNYRTSSSSSSWSSSSSNRTCTNVIPQGVLEMMQRLGADTLQTKLSFFAKKGTWPCGCSTLSSFLHRYLQENNFNLEMAIAYAQEGISWRSSFRPHLLRINDIAQFLKNYEMYYQGVGFNGFRNLWIENYKIHRANYHNNHVQIVEALSYMGETLLDERCTKINVVVDCAGLSFANFDERLERVLLEVMRICYPDSIGVVMLLSVPIWVKVLFFVVTPWLPKELKDKLVVIRSGDFEHIHRYIPRSELPERCKGFVRDQEFGVDAFLAARAHAENVDLNSPPSHEVDDRIKLWLSKSPRPAYQIPNKVAEGYLRKQGGVIKAYKRFFCVVHSGALFYFKGENEVCPMGVIMLDTATLENSAGKEFHITAPLRTFVFQAPTTEHKSYWMRVLSNEIAKAKSTVVEPQSVYALP